MIPKQLQNKEFRFIKLKPKSKIPIELNWQKTNNYTYDKIKDHDGNIGVVLGYGNLRVLDCDKKDFANEMLNQLPETFTVKTGSGGMHFYFISDYDDNAVLKGGNGEMRCKTYQVVAPSSTHPNGKTYDVIINKPIACLSEGIVKDILEPYLRENISTTGIKNDSNKDESRSGREYREVCRLIGKGKTKEDVYTEMEAFSKWSNAHPKYKENTYAKACDWIESERKKRQERY